MDGYWPFHRSGFCFYFVEKPLLSPKTGSMPRALQLVALLFLLHAPLVYGQAAKGYKIHSHNDYLQQVPFWTAYDSGLNSIEVDVFLKEGRLYATHSEAEIQREHTLEGLYLQALRKAIAQQPAKQQALQVLIDIKSEATTTLQELIEVLQQYPDLLKDKTISFVVSGNRPPPKTYASYPAYIWFDYQSLDDLSDTAVWDKVALISLNFRDVSSWNGTGILPPADVKKIAAIIDKAHWFGKPFRFWGCPDSEAAWKAFTGLGVDFINTDRPFECARYLKRLYKQTP